MADGAAGPDPTVHRRRLRNELRKARETAQMTQRDVAAAMDWSQSKLIRIETGAVNISTNDLRALLNHYGVEQAKIVSMVELARSAREQTKWNIYRDVAAPEYIAFCGYESSASVIRNFEPILIPGLLQTEEYARSVVSTFEANSPHRIDSLVDLRMQRQEIVTLDNPPSLHFVIDESVIRREVGGAEITRRQLKHLLELSEYPNVTIRIMPFSQGMYPRMRSPYVHFEFPAAEDEDILYLESPARGDIIRESSPEETEEVNPVIYLGIFWQLEQLAPKEEFRGKVEQRLADLER